MKNFTNNMAHQERGTVLILVLIITSLLATAAWSYTDEVDSLVDNTRDEGGALRAQFAAESGMEYAQRRLTIDPYWSGTGQGGFTLPDGITNFVITTGIDPNWVDEDKDGHDDEIEGGGEGGGEGSSPPCEEDLDHNGCEGDEDEHQHGHDHDCEDDEDDGYGGGHSLGDHSDCDHRGEHDDDHDGCDHDGDEANHDDDDCDHDHDSDGRCDHDGHHRDHDGDCDHDEDDDDDCGHDHDLDGSCDHEGNHDADDEDPDDDCDHDDDGADDCSHDHDGDGLCDHAHDGDGDFHDGDVSDNQVNLIRVLGTAGEARAQLGAAVKVYPGESGTSDMALIFLGKNYHMLRSTVIGDALFTDMENKVNDWVFDAYGIGHYVQGGSIHDGVTNLVQSAVDGTLYKFRDDRAYQDLGEERVIVDNAVAPAYDLSGFLVPGPGKTIYTGISSLEGVHLDDTAVFILDPGVKLTLTSCNFRGGMVVYCPTTYKLRDGYRNQVYLKGGTSIGGGHEGAESNLGLLAPAVKLTSAPNSGYGITGFTYVNEVGAMKDTFFHGQLVVLNQVSNLKDSLIIYDEAIAMAPPQSVGFGTTIGSTDIISVYEDFD
jgi:hypothetical protein